MANAVKASFEIEEGWRNDYGVNDRPAVSGVSTVATQLANACAAFNPRFDRKRFMKACGIDD